MPCTRRTWMPVTRHTHTVTRHTSRISFVSSAVRHPNAQYLEMREVAEIFRCQQLRARCAVREPDASSSASFQSRGVARK
jgi:hypothetical protein